MCKSVFSLFIATLLITPALLGESALDSSPLTQDLQAKLRSSVVTIVAEGFLTADGVTAVKKEGPAYIEKSRREGGCIQYQLQFDVSDPGHIFWYEQYASPGDFKTHVTSTYSKAWVDMLKPLSTKPIVIHFLNKIEHVEE